MQEDDKQDKPAKSRDEDVIEEAEPHAVPPIEPPYRAKLGSSQKKRSKLSQNTEQTPATPAAAPAVEPPKPDATPVAPAKRVRIKRSGQIRQDLTPPPEPPPPPDTAY